MLNIKFLFDYLDSQEKRADETVQELRDEGLYESDDYFVGYVQAIEDFRYYLKQTIELTKNDKPKRTTRTK